MAYKSVFPDGESLRWFDDGSYSLNELRYVSGLSGTTELAQRISALELAEVTPGASVLVSSATAGTARLKIITAAVKLMAKGQAVVNLQWGINDSPILDDSSWMVESYSETVRDYVGVDYQNTAIKLAYRPGWMSDAQWALSETARQYDRGLTVPGFHNRTHYIARKQISATAANLMTVHPQEWPSKYVHWVNAVAGGSGALPTVDAGIYLCAGIRTYSRNRELSFFVEAEFVSDVLGHEPIAVFQLNGLIPGDITVPAGMKYAWPTTRTMTPSLTETAGAARPQLLKGTRDFSADPLGFDVRLYYAV